MSKELNPHDSKQLSELVQSLLQWMIKTGNSFNHNRYAKNTESLYRFGWFIINNYKYSISGWKLQDGIVTFEDESSGEKIKYSIPEQKVIGKEFKRDTWYESIIKYSRYKLSNWLRGLSDKLQP